MKIIAVGANYACTDTPHTPAEAPSEPVIYLKPDSALLRDGRPFFLPDFSACMQYEAQLVVRISRLGKCIAPRFARRYYDAVTVGIDFTAADVQQRLSREGRPWELAKCFDNSAAIGEFVPLERLGGDVQNLRFRLDADGTTVQAGHTAEMLCSVDSLIAYVSRFMTLKIGDFLFTGTPAAAGTAAIGQHLQGYVEEQRVLDFHIR